MRIENGCERQAEGLPMMTWCQSKATIEIVGRLDPNIELKGDSRS